MRFVRLDPEDALIVRAPNWLGDFVMAEPTLRAIAAHRRERGHTGPIRVMAPRPFLELLNDPALEPLDANDDAGWRGHDVALLLTGSFRSAWKARKAGIPERIGWFRDGRRLLLTAGMRPARHGGARALGRAKSERILPRPYGATCVELAGVLGIGVADTRPRLTIDADASARVRARLDDAGLLDETPLVAVQAGARPGSAKGAPPELLASVIRRLPTDLCAVLVGGPGEQESVARVADLAGDARPITLMDPPLGLAELAALFDVASSVLTADSGPRHLAQAVGASIVCLFGPTDPRHTADHLEMTRLFRHEVPCGPCHRERCPLPGEERLVCWSSLDPAPIADALASSALVSTGT